MCKDECRDAWVKNPQGNCVGAELCSTVEYADNICAVKNKKNGTSCTSDKNQNDKRAICGERKDKPGMYCLSPVLGNYLQRIIRSNVGDRMEHLVMLCVQSILYLYALSRGVYA